MAKKSNLPHIPTLLERKLYKTGQTRGADDDEIYQNRVSRNSTVLIPYKFYKEEFSDNDIFERKFIVLLSPKEFFEEVSNWRFSSNLRSDSFSRLRISQDR